MNRLRRFWDEHPTLSNWTILAVGFVIMLAISGREVGFQPGQWAALIVVTVLVAGLCAWIISWE